MRYDEHLNKDVQHALNIIRYLRDSFHPRTRTQISQHLGSDVHGIVLTLEAEGIIARTDGPSPQYVLLSESARGLVDREPLVPMHHYTGY